MTALRELTVRNSVGLHARPAAAFVKTAAGFKCKVSVANLTKNTGPVNAKSMLSILSIGVTQDNRILVTCDGEDETAALEALEALVVSNFGEGG